MAAAPTPKAAVPEAGGDLLSGMMLPSEPGAQHLPGMPGQLRPGLGSRMQPGGESALAGLRKVY